MLVATQQQWLDFGSLLRVSQRRITIFRNGATYKDSADERRLQQCIVNTYHASTQCVPVLGWWSTGNTGAVNRLFVEHRFTVQSDLDSTHNPRGAPVPVPVPYLHELFARIESRLDQLESGDEECRRFQQHLWRCCYAGCAGTKMVDQSTARDTVVLLGPGMPESRNVDRRPTIYGTNGSPILLAIPSTPASSAC